MTKELSATALAFAREILGWQAPHESSNKKRPEVFSYRDCKLEGTLYYTHTGNVLAFARAWVNTMPGWFLQITSVEEGWSVLVSGPDDDGVGDSDDLRMALMQACLDAKRRVEGIKE